MAQSDCTKAFELGPEREENSYALKKAEELFAENAAEATIAAEQELLAEIAAEPGCKQKKTNTRLLLFATVRAVLVVHMLRFSNHACRCSSQAKALAHNRRHMASGR